MKITATETKTWRRMADRASIQFGDGHSAEIGYLKNYRSYLVILIDPEGGRHYGWHPIYGSCMHIPTSCDDWKHVKWAVKQHAALHGGIVGDNTI